MPVVLLEELELEQLQQLVLEQRLRQEQQLELLYRMHLLCIRCRSNLCRSSHCSSRRRFHNRKP
jgi:hypothetical protein